MVFYMITNNPEHHAMWKCLITPCDVEMPNNLLFQSKYYLSQEVQSVSFVSTVATKLYEGFRITNIALKSCRKQ